MRLGVRLVWQLTLTSFALLAATPSWAQDKVTLQLKWLHAFQFAGYYAALQQGYYRAAGLDVDIREGGAGVDVVKVLQDSKADFGVCTTSVLLEKPQDPQITVLSVIYQHSPAILLVPSRAGISTLSDLKGHRIMDSPSNPDVAAMLKHEGVDYMALPRIEHNGDPRDLISGKADAFVSYSIDEPFVLGQLGAPYRIFSPRAYGFDFYGDNLCTSAAQLSAHPDRARAFLTASLKGWDYALKHKEQMVDLILRQFPSQKTRAALLFEALQSEILIEPGLVPLGTQTSERWQSIANTYHDLGILADTRLPKTLIYQGNRPRAPPWLGPALLGLVFFAIATVLAWLLYKKYIRRLELGLAKPKLSMIMAGLFICLTIPILFFILIYNYQHNSEAIIATLRDDVEKARQAAIENIETMIQNVAGSLRMVAEMAGDDPGFFRTEKSRDVLYQALASAPEIDGIYVSFEDGYHRVVTRIDDDRRRSDPEIPPAANWHSSFIDDFSTGANRQRHRTFFDTWENVVAEYSVPTTIDMRTLPGYPAAKESRALVVTEPSINPDTGAPVLSVRVPISRNGEFIGVASANITLDVMSRFLATHRASRHSTTIVADPADGTVVASPDKQKGVQIIDGKLDIARLQNIDDEDVREAYRLHTQMNQDEFLFPSPHDGRELSASFARFPESFGRPWEAVILTPTDDFIGQMKATNQKIVVLIITLSAVELLLIYLLSRRLAQPIESISRDLKSVEELSFAQTPHRSSKVREIAQLQAAAALLRNSLQSFSAFAPVDVVKGLIKSGIPLALGVEKRSLTIFFSDLEDFSSLAERANPDELLEQMSVYFEQVSRAISDEHGTVDKFIGDGIMAFWGAPIALEDHALRACTGALRAARRMQQVNDEWRRQGKPSFRLRIGLNSANVLVGNVGSTERFSYTVMGDGVNVASRLEGMNKSFGTNICISDSVFDALSNEIVARPLRRVQVKGRKQEFMIYELLGMIDSNDPELEARPDDKLLNDMTWVASRSFEQRDFTAAARHYREILQRFPDDPLAKSMLAACVPNLMPAATDADWA
jgi:class 3 adenylate cyclase/ABC-type nitrate/sulfonate/bicarbonate transport system substrate-binding protein